MFLYWIILTFAFIASFGAYILYKLYQGFTNNKSNSESDFGSLMLGYTFFMLLIFVWVMVLVNHFMEDTTPEPIDVYRGKTELQITRKCVNDSVVECDSVVVFKKNI